MAEFQSLVGGRLGQFEIKDELGRGGMAVVYKGYQASLDRWVAIKTLPQEFAGKREMVSRFHREAEAMVSLNHSNIVQIIDKGEDKGLYYFAMEFVDGPSLQDLLKESRSKDLMFDIAQQVTEGLSYAHKKGIVHRDIKPGNVLWETATSLAKIADFGIARLTQKPEEMITLTATNVGMGTMNYMAPEQKTDAASVDHRADIYSLGVMIYEMFTGTLPMGRFKLPSVLDSSLPKKLDEIVTKCMEPDPAERYANMEELAADLAYARQHAGDGGALVRSVRDVADRTLTAIAGEQHKGKAGFACCLLIMIGLGFGGFAAYSKGLIPGVGPQVAAKTEKTKKTRRTSSSGDDDDAPGKTDDAPGKTDSKTDDQPTKTPDPDPTPTETKDPDPTPTETKDPNPTPTKTNDPTPTPTKTNDPTPTPTKTNDPTPTPTKTPTPKPTPTSKVDQVALALKRDFDTAREAVQAHLKRVAQLSQDWDLAAKSLKAADAAARKGLKAKPTKQSVKALQGAASKLQRELALALGGRILDTLKEAGKLDGNEIRSHLRSAGRSRREARAKPTAEQIELYVKVLEQFTERRAEVARARAEAIQAVARQRYSAKELATAERDYEAGRRAQGARRFQEALSRFVKVREACMKLRPPTPRAVRFFAKGKAESVSTVARHFNSIAPAPRGRVYAVCKRPGASSLHLLAPSGKGLAEKWSISLSANMNTVASGGVDTTGNYLVWVATQSSKGSRIQQLRLDAQNGSAIDDGTPMPKFDVPDWVYDIAVGNDGRLYVLSSNKVLVYSRGRRINSASYATKDLSKAPTHPRRLAVLDDGRVIVSALEVSSSAKELVGKSTEWTKVALQSLLFPGGQAGTIRHGQTTPIAITGVGNAFIAHDHGQILEERNGRHIVLHPQGENGTRLSGSVPFGVRPTLSSDMAYANGKLYVLDTFKLVGATIMGRERIIVYSVDGN